MTPSLRAVVAASIRWWWLMALIVAVSVGTAVVLTGRQQPLYLASTTLVVAPAASLSGPSDVLRSLEALERRTVIATFARIPSSPESRAQVATRAELDSAAIRPYRFEARVLPNTNLIRLDVEGPDPGRAALLANTGAEVLGEEAEALYRIYALKPLAKAAVPRRPVFPDRQRNVLVALMVGLALGAATVFGLACRQAWRSG